MKPRRKKPAPDSYRRAVATSVVLHAAGLAGAAVAGGAALEAVSWASDAGVPIQLSLRADPPMPEFTVDEPAPHPVPRAPDDCCDDLPELPAVPVEWKPPSEILDAFGARLPDPPPDRLPASSLAIRYRALPEPTPSKAPDEHAIADAPAGALVQASPLPGDNMPPCYPFVAWRRGIEGRVTVILEIDATGTVSAAHVEASSGSSLLDDAALSKLSTWRFTPATDGGHAVRSTFRQVVIFRLDGPPELENSAIRTQ